MKCAGCCEDKDCPCTKECDVDGACERHAEESFEEARAYFGRNPAAMRPVETITDAEWAEWRSLK